MCRQTPNIFYLFPHHPMFSAHPFSPLKLHLLTNPKRRVKRTHPALPAGNLPPLKTANSKLLTSERSARGSAIEEEKLKLSHLGSRREKERTERASRAKNEDERTTLEGHSAALYTLPACPRWSDVAEGRRPPINPRAFYRTPRLLSCRRTPESCAGWGKKFRGEENFFSSSKLRLRMGR